VSASQGGWKTDAINAAEQLLSLTPGSSGQRRWKSIGQAKASAEPGWLMLDRRGDPISPDTLNDLCFAANGGPDVATAYPIETFRHVDDVFLIKEPPALPAGSRMVWVKSTSLRLLVEKLLTGLRESGMTPIADALAAGRLATAAKHGIPESPGLIGPQIEAYRACLNPGVRLVWGPPGAGKTRVLARVIEDLVNAGKRVLLVSTANVAVDNALLAVVKAMRPARGTVVRVGPPHLAEVANNPDVQLQQLTAAASSQVDEERLAIEQQLADLDEIVAQVNTLSERVGGFSSSAYQAASQRIDNERRFEELTNHVREAEQVWKAASRDATARRVAAQHARNEANRVADARDALRKIDEWTDQLRSLELDTESKRAELTSTELRLRNASGMWATIKTKRTRDKAAQDLASFEQLAGEQRPRLAALITAHQAKVGPITRDHIDRLDADLKQADRATEQAHQDEASAAAHLRTYAPSARPYGAPACPRRMIENSFTNVWPTTCPPRSSSCNVSKASSVRLHPVAARWRSGIGIWSTSRASSVRTPRRR
jgi:AAA domain